MTRSPHDSTSIALMTVNINTGPSHRASDEEDSLESAVEVAQPSPTGSHEYEDPYEEWADLPLPDEPKPRNKTSRLRRQGRSRYWAAAPSYTGVSRQDDCIVSSDDNDKDITTHLHLDVALDLEHELGYLAQLNRMGHFKKGIRYFEKRLAPHVDFFPVVAEYADLLLEQGSLGDLHIFISSRLMDPHVSYLEEENILLKTIRAYAEIFTKGALIPALNMTREALNHLATRDHDSMGSSLSTGLKIQLVEVCVRIIVHAAEVSDFLESGPFQSLLHWSISDDGAISMTYEDEQDEEFHDMGLPKNNNHRQNHPQIGAWYRFLLRKGFPWDAYRILRYMLSMLGRLDVYVPNGGFEKFVQLKNISQAGDILLLPEDIQWDDEQLLLAELAQSTLLVGFLSEQCSIETVRIAHSQCFKKSHSLASRIIVQYPHLINTQPYLCWLLLESMRNLSASRQLPKPVNINMTSLLPDRWSWNVFDRLHIFRQRNLIIAEKTEQPKVTDRYFSCKSLETLIESARDLGGYRLERSLLELIFQYSLDWDQCLQTVRGLSRLNQETMDDTCGYLKCLIGEFFFLENYSSPECASLREELYGRFSAFDGSFPVRFDYDTAVVENSDIVFFDNPFLKYMERKVQCLLLSDIGKGIEAELLRLKLSHMVDHHLPSKFQSKLDSTDTYSAYIDHAASAQVPRFAGYRTSDRATRSAGNETYDATPESSGLRQEGPHRMPRLNLQDTQSKKDAVEDIRLSLDRLIQQGRNSERAKAMVKLVDGEEAVKQERRRLQEEITRVRRVLLNAEEMARVAEKTSTPLLTLIDPVGREYLLPYNQCRSLEVMEKLIKKIFRSDEILARPIARGDYEFTSIDGDPITRDGWDSAIQPGRTIMIHIVLDLEKEGPIPETRESKH